MAARGVKRHYGWSRQISDLSLSVLALLLFLTGSGSFANAGTNFYYRRDLDALQNIWVNWSKTPNLSDNLPGWSSEETDTSSIYPCQSLSNAKAKQSCSLYNGVVSKYPCQNLSNPDVTIPNWRGVFCFKTNYDEKSGNSTILVNGLSISNASIVGSLPPDIGDLFELTTLELTGNPDLTGPLPDRLGGMFLNILDVHGNGFTGPIPDTFVNSSYLQQFDLSGNQLEGGYPFYQTSTMAYLQVLSIGDNLLRGELPADAFANKTELETLDISNNRFNGTLPDLNPMKKNLEYLDVSGNEFEGQLPDLVNFPKLSTANFGGNKFVLGNAPLLDILWNESATSTALTTLNLSYNQLSGALSSWNSAPSLGFIQSLLYLDNNTLSGTLDISKMLAWGLLEERSSVGLAQNATGRRLNTMSLRNNNISHVVSAPYAIANTTTIFILQGNPYCVNYDSKDDAQRCYCTQYCYVTPASLQSDRRRIATIAAVCSVLAVVFILLLVVGAILIKNRRYKQYLQLQVQQKFEEFDVKPTIFSYNELRAATRDFHEDMKLGQGSYGAVYKGVLPNGNVVAVKQLYARAAQGMDESLNEVVLITGMRHRNLVNLKGCCLREHQRLLVYEYVDNFNIDQIFLERGSTRRQAVSWPMRLKICLGIARGLHYLHALAHPRVIHRDIKASNVLLDKNLEPKIADFGLALLFADEETHIMTIHVAGTKGYLAPEYASLGQLSDKVDVYGFGVLCLEIVSGRRNIDQTRPQDQVYLSQWVWQLHSEGRLMELVDPTLQLTDEDARDVQRVINVCLLCIQTAAEKRPTMARIVSILQSDTESDVQVPSSDKGERPPFQLTFESILRSQQLAQFTSTGLESLAEEAASSSTGLTSLAEEAGSSSSDYRATSSLSPGFSKRRRGGGAVELREIVTR